MILAESSSGKILFSDLASPITTDAIYILGAGTILTAGIMLEKHNIANQTEHELRSESPLANKGYIGEVVGYRINIFALLFLIS